MPGLLFVYSGGVAPMCTACLFHSIFMVGVVCLCTFFDLFMPLDFAFFCWIFRFLAGRWLCTDSVVFKFVVSPLCNTNFECQAHTTYINNKRQWKYCLLILLKYPYTNRLHMCNTHNPTCLGSIERRRKNTIEYWFWFHFIIIIIVNCVSHRVGIVIVCPRHDIEHQNFNLFQIVQTEQIQNPKLTICT